MKHLFCVFSEKSQLKRVFTFLHHLIIPSPLEEFLILFHNHILCHLSGLALSYLFLGCAVCCSSSSISLVTFRNAGSQKLIVTPDSLVAFSLSACASSEQCVVAARRAAILKSHDNKEYENRLVRDKL